MDEARACDISRELTGKILLISLMITLLWTTDSQAAERLIRNTHPQQQISVHQETGLLNFIGTPQGQAIPLGKPPKGQASEDYGVAYINEYGAAFGIEDVPGQLRLKPNANDADRGEILRYEQMYRGIPVFAGELVVNLDKEKNLRSMSGEIAPALSLPVTPFLTADDARSIALEAASKWHGIEQSALRSSAPSLAVYDARLLKPGISEPTLVWQLDVTPLDTAPIRELILVDAHTGTINLHFNRVDEARNRATHNAGTTSTLPGDLACSEGDSLAACARGDADIIDAHTFAGDAYDFYSDMHGRDGIDGIGSVITSSVHWFQAGICPNAFWDGQQVVFCTNMASADDIVAHELTHGVTDHESNLLNYYESGAINESLSDVWGEFVDLTNGRGNDSASVRWLIGEDLVSAGGAFRDMRFPENFGDPDRMTSPSYHTSSINQGGVHTNSGVNNKAAFLMTDGGTFNGITVNGLGINKTAKIYYEAQTNLLTSGSDYADLYQALYQACLNLVGTSAISTADCAEVRNATDAVEMNLDPAGDPDFAPTATLCPGEREQEDVLFFDDLESGSEAWSTGTVPWYHFSYYATSGTYSIGSPDAEEVRDSSAWNTLPVAVTANTYLHFSHSFGFESWDTDFYDGGVIEYSTDGNTWQDLASLHDAGQDYGGVIHSDWGNPLAGRTAFVAESHGFVSSRYNLGALAGQSIQIRFRMGSDSSISGPMGWMVDDVSIYNCAADPGTPPQCSGTNVLVQNMDFTVDTTCQASLSLEANTAVVVRNGVNVTFESAGTTTLGAGFSVEQGARLTVTNGQ